MKMTPQHHQAAALLGQGWKRDAVAAEVGVHPVSVSRWRDDPDFEAAVENARRAHLAENPTAAATLEAALSATRANGTPDWPTRVAAARALLGAKAASGSPAEVVRQTRVFVGTADE
jgi:hypothetical protein